MFERQAAATPDALAVVSDGGRKLTYAQLNRSCDVLATWLRTRAGVGADVGVGIYMGRTIEYVIAYVAILKAGWCVWVVCLWAVWWRRGRGRLRAFCCGNKDDLM